MYNSKKKKIGQRINAALASSNITQKVLAKQLEVTDNTVSYWCNGHRVPNIEQLIKISSFLSVSTDYLLGLSNVPTTDLNIREICEYTGLSEKSVCNLNNQRGMVQFDVFGKEHSTGIMEIINFFLEDNALAPFSSILIYKTLMERALYELKENMIKCKEGIVSLNDEELKKSAIFNLFIANEDFKRKIDELVTSRQEYEDLYNCYKNEIEMLLKKIGDDNGND